MKVLLMFMLAFLPPSVWAFGGTVGNGGDAVAQEFTEYGQTSARFLVSMTTKLITASQVQAFVTAVATAKVTTKDRLFLHRDEVDAINYPYKGLIEVSLSRWGNTEKTTKSRHWALSLHEYLSLAGVDDTHYRVSNPLFAEIQSLAGGFPYYSCESHVQLYKIDIMLWEDKQSVNVGYVGTQFIGVQILSHPTPMGPVTTAVQVDVSKDLNSSMQNASYYDVASAFGNFNSSAEYSSIAEALPQRFRLSLPDRPTTGGQLKFTLNCHSLL